LEPLPAIDEVRTLRLDPIDVLVGPARELAEKLADEIRVLMEEKSRKGRCC
jgi:hypothetical protein